MPLPNRIAALGALVSMIGSSTACPARVEQPQGKTGRVAPAVSADDPRVVQDGEDLYAASVLERAEEKQHPSSKGEPGLGSGRPDESNGVCRLFAPQLPEPECCAAEYGFDAEAVKEACGHEIYLGESFQFSCGYYFHEEGKRPPWFRTSFLPSATPAEAARSHDRKMQELLHDPSFASTPVPGVEGALWSSHDGHRWAFLPGWSKVRQLAWTDDSCSEKGAIEVIKQLVAAKEPPPKAQRLALIPKAR